jgi:hypothetical protein
MRSPFLQCRCVCRVYDEMAKYVGQPEIYAKVQFVPRSEQFASVIETNKSCVRK